MRIDCTGREVTRTEATERQYATKVRQLINQAMRAGFANTPEETLSWFVVQDGRWSRATVRLYRSAWHYAIEMLLAAGKIDEARMEDLFIALGDGPRPHDKSGPKRISARKRKSLPETEFSRLLGALKRHGTSDAWMLHGMLSFNILLFLRPAEFFGATVNGPVLVIQSGKATNGRGLGTDRARDLSVMTSGQRTALARLLARLQRAARLSGDPARLLSRLAGLLARICAREGLRRVCLYTTRHVGLATAKRHMSPIEVAAAAGHCTTRTATAHYARRRTGWRNARLIMIAATTETISRVHVSAKQNREMNLSQGRMDFA